MLRKIHLTRNSPVFNASTLGAIVCGMTERLTITIPEVAELLGISRGAAYSAAGEQTIPTIRIGRRLLVPRVALDRLLRGDRDEQAGQ
jgi:excisionase family DNA binding protein